MKIYLVEEGYVSESSIEDLMKEVEKMGDKKILTWDRDALDRTATLSSVFKAVPEIF